MSKDLAPAHRHRLYEAIIGERNQAYYLSYFERADARGYPPVAWHWPVLFFGVLWFLYRKMYRWALVSFALPYLASFVATGVDQFAPGSGNYLFWPIIIGYYAVWLPLVTNGLYYKQAQRIMGAARVLYEDHDENQVSILRARGGVYSQLPLVLIGVLTLVSMIMSSLSGIQQ